MDITFALITSLACLGVHAALTWDGMPLQAISRAFDRIDKWPNAMALIQKPLFNCLPCMGSVYTILHWIYCGYSLHWQLLVMILAVVGINSIIALFIRLIEAIEDIHSEILKNE